MQRTLLVLLCWVAAATQGAQGETRSFSYSTWTVADSTVMLKFLLPAGEARTLTGSEVPLLTTRKLGDYVLEHVSVTSAGRACPAIDQGFDIGKVDPLSVGRDLYGFEILFRCPDAKDRVLHNSVMFGREAGHIDFARILSGGSTTEQLFTSGRQSVAIENSGAVPAATLGSFVWLGWLHILFSADRLCFLIGAVLLLNAASLRGGAVLGTAQRYLNSGTLLLGLAGGYGLSLAVLATGWIAPRMSLLEAFIGVLVVLPALTIMLLELRLPRAAAAAYAGLLLALSIAAQIMGCAPQALLLLGAALLVAGIFGLCSRNAGRWGLWLVPALLLGFLDGFELPARVAPLQLPQRLQLWMSGGFDLGALLAAILAVTALAGGAQRLPNWNLSRVRIACAELLTASLGGLGTFWLLSRLYA